MSGIRSGFRAAAHDPWFTVLTVAVLTVGVGATAAVFTVAHGVLLRPLPYPSPDRLVWIVNYPTRTGVGDRGLLGADFLEIRRLNHSFESAACYLEVTWNGTGFGDAVRLSGARVSRGFFETLGVRPILGRLFSPGSHHTGRDSEVLLSYQLWHRMFGGDPSVVGRRLTLTMFPMKW